MPLRVARIPFLNCAPFYWRKPDSGRCSLVSVTPKKLGVELRLGKIDAGPVSLADSFECENRFEPLADLGIAVNGRVGSVTLFSKKPVSELAGGVIGLTSDSVTSVRLLKFVLEGYHGVEATYREGFSPADSARLLIGDEALKALRDPAIKKLFPLAFDLGEEWRNWQDLPFVFARWMVRKGLSPSDKKYLADYLDKNLDSASKNLKRAAAEHEKSGGFRYENSVNYLKGFIYRLSDSEHKAIAKFRRLMKGFAATVCGC